MELNFNNTRKKFFKIVLNDKEQTKLFLKTPTKALMEKMITLETDGNNIIDSNEKIENTYNVVAQIMSRNTANKMITQEKLEELLDFEDITIFMQTYVDFISDVAKSKNFNCPTTHKKK